MEKRKRGRQARSSFYYTRWHKVGLNEERTAELLGCSVDDVRRFDWQGNEIAERFLLLWDTKRLYDEWNGFVFSRGTLRYKHKQWTPETLRRQAEE